jgi:RNA polymerase sigma-70 factor (ECF subfamily)
LVQQLSDPHIAEEVLQDVMLAVWKSAATFRGDSKVYTWMLAIARHRAVTERQRKPRHQVDLNEELAADGISPPEVYERQSERERAYRALHNLPPEQRETMELIFYHGLTGPEVAQIMNVSVGTVKSRLRLAKAALHKCLTLKEVQDA